MRLLKAFGALFLVFPTFNTKQIKKRQKNNFCPQYIDRTILKKYLYMVQKKTQWFRQLSETNRPTSNVKLLMA